MKLESKSDTSDPGSRGGGPLLLGRPFPTCSFAFLTNATYAILLQPTPIAHIQHIFHDKRHLRVFFINFFGLGVNHAHFRLTSAFVLLPSSPPIQKTRERKRLRKEGHPYPGFVCYRHIFFLSCGEWVSQRRTGYLQHTSRTYRAPPLPANRHADRTAITYTTSNPEAACPSITIVLALTSTKAPTPLHQTHVARRSWAV
jgi:hypothetical protein